MAEVHVVGEISGASGFASSRLLCKWAFVSGNVWKILEGHDSGQTQVDDPQVLDLLKSRLVVTGPSNSFLWCCTSQSLSSQKK